MDKPEVVKGNSYENCCTDFAYIWKLHTGERSIGLSDGDVPPQISAGPKYNVPEAEKAAKHHFPKIRRSPKQEADVPSTTCPRNGHSNKEQARKDDLQ